MISEQAVRDRIKKYSALIAEGKIEEAYAGCADNASSLGSAGSYTLGKQDIVKNALEQQEYAGKGRLSFEVIEFRPLGDTAASVVLRWTFESPDESAKGLCLTIYQEIDGQLVYVQGVTTHEPEEE